MLRAHRPAPRWPRQPRASCPSPSCTHSLPHARFRRHALPHTLYITNTINNGRRLDARAQLRFLVQSTNLCFSLIISILATTQLTLYITTYISSLACLRVSWLFAIPSSLCYHPPAAPRAFYTPIPDRAYTSALGLGPAHAHHPHPGGRPRRPPLRHSVRTSVPPLCSPSPAIHLWNLGGSFQPDSFGLEVTQGTKAHFAFNPWMPADVGAGTLGMEERARAKLVALVAHLPPSV
ncbi:hypothetical protein C8R47DRAFT_1206777 [Mycena vitilis]|nr:hypothetical protein C8R47DRAFT_1206777 [Mycena vitilis]